jgi:hypothetical protein
VSVGNEPKPKIATETNTHDRSSSRVYYGEYVACLNEQPVRIDGTNNQQLVSRTLPQVLGNLLTFRPTCAASEYYADVVSTDEVDTNVSGFYD